jgi:hypothetical protein
MGETAGRVGEIPLVVVAHTRQRSVHAVTLDAGLCRRWSFRACLSGVKDTGLQKNLKTYQIFLDFGYRERIC